MNIRSRARRRDSGKMSRDSPSLRDLQKFYLKKQKRREEDRGSRQNHSAFSVSTRAPRPRNGIRVGRQEAGKVRDARVSELGRGEGGVLFVIVMIVMIATPGLKGGNALGRFFKGAGVA